MHWQTRIGVALLTTVSVGALAAPAQAASTGTAKVSGTTVLFTAASSATNKLVVKQTGRTVILDDRVAIKAGAGCKAVKGDKTKVKCTTKKYPKLIKVSLGHKNDIFRYTSTGATPVPASVSGGTGNDTITGSNARDVLNGDSGTDTISGGNGNDTLVGGKGNDRLSGGAGDDALTDDSGGDTLRGDAGNDRLSAGIGNDRLYGGAGNDSLTGGVEMDVMYGEAGNDRFSGMSGSDSIYAGPGTDTVSYSYVPAVASLRVELFDNRASVIYPYGAPDDNDYLSEVENLIGSAGDDHLFGDDGPNVIDGGAGADYLVGRDGDDTIFGGIGADDLVGDAGDDWLWTEPAGSNSGSESAYGYGNRTTSPGDTCYVPPVGVHEVIECETIPAA